MEDFVEHPIKSEPVDEAPTSLQNTIKAEYDPNGPDCYEPYEPEFLSPDSSEYVPVYVPSSISLQDENFEYTPTVLPSDSAIDLSYVEPDNCAYSDNSNDSCDITVSESNTQFLSKSDVQESIIQEEPRIPLNHTISQLCTYEEYPKRRQFNDAFSTAVGELLDFVSVKNKQKGPFDHNEGCSDDDQIQVLEGRVRSVRQSHCEERNLEKKKILKKLFAVGELISDLRGHAHIKEEITDDRTRIVLDFNGRVLSNSNSARRPDGMREPIWLPLEELIKLEMETRSVKPGLLEQIFDLPPSPEHPRRVEDIRRLVRSKMPRCKICKSRFGERVLLEFHMKKVHPDQYLEFLLDQEKEAQAQRENELQQNRLEELYCGGFIPPEEDYMAENVKHEVNEIPLPGELSANGKPAHVIDRWGTISQPRFKFKKKVSPQCPLCDKRFRNDISLKKHLWKKHPEIEEMNQCLKCFKVTVSPLDHDNHDCDMSFLCFECTPIRNMCSAIRLANHRAKFHRGANSGFRCNECNQKFLTPRKLRKHKKMSHVFTKTYPCHFCEELFTNEVGVMTHERIHTGIVKFECQICDFRCNRYVEMEFHKREEHGYMCAICLEKFGDWADIKNHTLIEHGGYLTQETSYIESPRVWVMFKGE